MSQSWTQLLTPSILERHPTQPVTPFPSALARNSQLIGLSLAHRPRRPSIVHVCAVIRADLSRSSDGSVGCLSNHDFAKQGTFSFREALADPKNCRLTGIPFVFHILSAFGHLASFVQAPFNFFLSFTPSLSVHTSATQDHAPTRETSLSAADDRQHFLHRHNQPWIYNPHSSHSYLLGHKSTLLSFIST